VNKRQLFKLIGKGGVGSPDVFRYERKYVVSEIMAESIRQFITPYLTPDDHMKAEEPRGYQVHSLYLDTPQFAMYRQTVEGIRSRYKLRIRFYDNLDESLALFEIKTRLADSIHKQRAAVAKSSVCRFLCGGMLSSADLLSPGEKSVRALAEFCERRHRMHAEGSAFVSYWREAYVSRQPDDVRVTMDRHLAGANGCQVQSLKLPQDEVPAAPGKVVLELKNSGRAPNWMRDLVRTFKLQRVSFPKYVYCVDALQLATPSARRTAERASC
jgi:hypothetical protein